MNKELYKLVGELNALRQSAKNGWGEKVVERAATELEKIADIANFHAEITEEGIANAVNPGDHFVLCGVEWIALERHGDTMLSITAEPIDGKLVFDDGNSNKWSTSDIRQSLDDWLSGLYDPSGSAFKTMHDEQTDTAGEVVDKPCDDMARLLTLEEYLRFMRLGYIKVDKAGAVRTWLWTMSAHRGNAYNVWFVTASGGVTNTYANFGYRVCPVCEIKLDAIKHIV